MKNAAKVILVLPMVFSGLMGNDSPPYVDFNLSMGLTSKHSYKNARHWATPQEAKETLDFLRQLYTKNISLLDTPKRDPIIPKIIHQIWIGPNTPPAIFKESQESLKRLHPNWEYKLWTDADIPTFNLTNKKRYDEARNYGEKADILRYEILYRHGGLYADVDILCVKPFDVLHHSLEFYAGLEPLDSWGLIGNALFGSRAGHPVLKNCIENLEASWTTYSTKKSLSRRTMFGTGPVFFQKSFLISAHANNDGCIVFPASYFYPLSFKKSNRSNCIKQETFAIHHWATSWVLPKTKKNSIP